MQVRLWAQQVVLAYLDEQPATAQNLITEIASAHSVPSRWQVAADEVAALHRGWVQVAVGFHGDQMWTPEQQSTGHRAVVEKVVPESLRHQVLAQVDVLDAHEEAVAAAGAAGEAVPDHPWLGQSQVGPFILHAAATLIVWLAEQPQVHEGQPSRVRDELLDEIDRTTAQLGAAPQAGTGEPAPDQAALDLLIDLHDGEDIARVPADPAKRGPVHNALVEIAAKHLREHDGAAPTPRQAEQLRREIMRTLGAIVDHEDPAAVIPADTPALDADDRDAVDTFTMRMLHGVLTHSAPAVRDAANAISAYGPRGQRLARQRIEELGQVWFTRLRRTTTVRTSTLLPGMQSIIDRVVPHEHRERTGNAQLPVLMKIGPEGPADLHPYPTRDIEADLYLMAAYCGWMGIQPQTNPQRIRTELAHVVAYLGREDRTRSVLHLSDEERALAHATLRELIGPAADQLPDPETQGEEADRLLAAAFDARHDADAAAQVRRIADCRQDRAEALREETRARGRTLSPQEQAARREAERELRAKRKKKKRKN
ncbi:hypothetical protein GCM10010470_66980 [Saccharopolyspora taberi]|uniref:Uncharacterized protein n=2 Tax=Saccharopolyspora taberi TaxID=60895 RepID=A0ABN3VNF9_9PSEU